MIMVSLLFMLLPSLSMSENECFDGEDYILKSSNDFSTVSIRNQVNSLKLTPVGTKLCGFSMEPSDFFCDEKVLVKFAAFPVSERNGSRCSIYSDQIICVCDYFACNSVEGVFYESMVKSLGTPRDTSIRHPQNYEPFTLWDRDQAITRCAMKIVEKAYGESVSSPIQEPYDVAAYKFEHPNLFPKPADVEAKLQLDYVKFPATTTTLRPSTSISTSTLSSTTPTSTGSSATLASDTYDTIIWGLIVGCVLLVIIVGAVLGFVGYQLLHI